MSIKLLRDMAALELNSFEGVKMTIKIAGDQYKQNSEYYEQQIRHLIVDGVERYRLVVGEGGTGTTGLVYAKGKIHFNWN